MEDINSQERDSVSFWATFIFGCHFSTSMWQIFLITQLVEGFPDKDLREFKIFWLFAKLHGICRGYLQENMYHFSFFRYQFRFMPFPVKSDTLWCLINASPRLLISEKNFPTPWTLLEPHRFANLNISNCKIFKHTLISLKFASL